MTQLTDIDTIQKMFDAYNTSTGFAVPFNMAWERMMWDAAQMGLTAEMIVLVVKDRQKGIRSGERKPASIMPRNLFMGDDVINETLCEAHALMAAKRKVVDLNRASVLKATGRAEDYVGISGQEETPPDQARCKPTSELLQNLIEQFRRAAG